jgi:dCTP deaminase
LIQKLYSQSFCEKGLLLMMSLLNEIQMLERLLHPDEAKRILVTPLIQPNEQFGPTSLDLRLGSDFQVIQRTNQTHLDPLDPPAQLEQNIRDLWKTVQIPPGEAFILHPGEFALAATLEHVRIPLDIAARLEGRSTWGRLGLQIHATAGFVDPGFSGALTFELSNVSSIPLPLYPGVRIAQICFYEAHPTVLSYIEKPFTKYSGQTGSATSAFFRDPEYERLRRRKAEAALSPQAFPSRV